MTIIDRNKLNTLILDTAIEVHQVLGPGLPEFIYKDCFVKELAIRQVPFRQHVPFTISYKGEAFKNELKIDVLVAEEVVVKIVADDNSQQNNHLSLLNAILKFTGKNTAILINFNNIKLIDGYKKITKAFN